MEEANRCSTIIAGPIIRHCDVTQLNFWLVTTKVYNFTFKLYINDKSNGSSEKEVGKHSPLLEVELSSAGVFSANRELSKNETKGDISESQLQQIRIGKSAYVNLITICAEGGGSENAFPESKLLSYDIITSLPDDKGKTESITGLCSLLYPEQSLPNFIIKPTINRLLHGSCRKPHHIDDDGLKQVDNVLRKSLSQQSTSESSKDLTDRPSLLMMSGDQVYVDDVAGPTLNAIHQVIEKLGLYDEEWETDINIAANGDESAESNETLKNNKVTHSQALYKHEHCYYQRQHILPKYMEKTLFGEKVSSIFTSAHVQNHLITLSEVMAMYLLTWSPELWDIVEIDEPPENLSQDFKEGYLQELEKIKSFHQGLFEVRRAMAHIPVYMIFDDHDITDDWNLTRGWEEAVYNHSFSKQIIGNALIGYLLCQGWGNAPEKFTQILVKQSKVFNEYGYKHKPALIEELLDFDQWNYNLNTIPKIVVLDTRTQRWRSESNANKPSGLMDWETLTDFQQEIVREPNVIVVSPAPIYGVKLIETIQRLFTLCGKPLVVDAENWMAHSGTANVILNIFRNPRTPPNFIILSGDVHYSFVYEVTHRFRKNSAKITQITASGIKNTFPKKLLTTLEKLNKVLYATYSPLNWFTKRRRMKIRVRKPNVTQDTHLLNRSGIGVLRLTSQSDEVITEFITSDGENIEFIQYEADDE